MGNLRLRLSSICAFVLLAASACGTDDGGPVDEVDQARAPADLGRTAADLSRAAPDLTRPSCTDRLKNGDETDVDCGGDDCDPCADGKECATDDDCESRSCSGSECRAPSCSDGVKNGDEVDIDCAGSCASKCGDGLRCNGNGDCQSGGCVGGTCAIASCTDGRRNGAETDVDCGGGTCDGCDDGQACSAGIDCASRNCVADICATATCVDSIRNSTETDVDCGGSCPKCAAGKSCGGSNDCASGVCTAGTCAAAGCSDGVRNGTETDTDCGGPDCPDCADTRRCNDASDCASGVCSGNPKTCRPPTCRDRVANGSESDVDCGGGAAGSTCAACGVGKICKVGTDCTTTLCDFSSPGAPNKTCQSSCSTGVREGTETDVDCGGGVCPACIDGKRCSVGTDCTSGVCSGSPKTCRAPTCTDTVTNGMETDVDCGGVAAGSRCSTCADGKACTIGSDCSSSVCTNRICQAPVCTDRVKNGLETDVDCGGGTCPTCVNGRRCARGADCTSGTCTNQVCVAPTCTDLVKNGLETDIDCGGGTCPRCAAGKTCAVGRDCMDGVCTNNTCVGSCSDGVKTGAETDVDCGGDTSCARCAYNRLCAANADCASSLCVGGRCREVSCNALHAREPSLGNASYTIAPDSSTAVLVWCDMTTSGGGWTVVSINGSLVTNGTCLHRLASNAPACGTTPSLTVDWQLTGTGMNLINFREILYTSYTLGTGNALVLSAATRMTAPAARTVGTGAITVVPTGVTGTPLNCAGSTLSGRTKIGVDINGYTLWGSDGPTVCGLTCPGTAGICENMGLNVVTTNGGHDSAGYDDNNDGCGCSNTFTPPEARLRRGYYGLR